MPVAVGSLGGAVTVGDGTLGFVVAVGDALSLFLVCPKTLYTALEIRDQVKNWNGTSQTSGYQLKTLFAGLSRYKIVPAKKNLLKNRHRVLHRCNYPSCN